LDVDVQLELHGHEEVLDDDAGGAKEDFQLQTVAPGD
jgi:hypothetical protein